ncbi:MAG TPA: long-chain-fatty-acid--CoA ligase [Caulobacteraceae bacterium]|nr:long-chain-fatty-acid--CoA ligase [Caulobacteraceae bacterium]
MSALATPACVADIARIQARGRPDQAAIDFQGRVTSFADFDALSSRCANALIAAGVQAGDRIAVLAKGCDDFFILWFGALKARACLAPVNWRLAPPEIAFIVQDAGAKLWFFGETYREVTEALAAQCPSIERTIGFDGPSGALPAFRDWIAEFPDIDPALASDPQDDVIQLYTSGTTGLPKGVQLTEANYAAAFASATQGWGRFDAGDAVLVAMPLFHVAGTNMGLLSLLQGATAIVLAEAAPAAILDAVERHRIRQAFLVPALINMVLQHPAMREERLESLEKVYYGASPISEEVLKTAQRRFGASFTQLYGLTETNGIGTWLSPQAHAEGRLRACGVASPGAEVRVRAGGRDAAPLEVGEIEIRAGTVMKGYWGRAEATAQAIDAEGWFRTGDAGYFDAEGYLHIHDRVKDMIVSGGENVYPAEVENALFSHPHVADAAVIGVPDERWGEAVKAIVVLREGARPDPAGIIAHCRERIAGYKTPKSVDFAEALPRNPSGKVLRRQLREPYWAGRERRVG